MTREGQFMQQVPKGDGSDGHARPEHYASIAGHQMASMWCLINPDATFVRKIWPMTKVYG